MIKNRPFSFKAKLTAIAGLGLTKENAVLTSAGLEWIRIAAVMVQRLLYVVLREKVPQGCPVH